MIDKYLRLLTKQIDDKVELLREAIGNGSARDYAEYKGMVGEVKGLLTCRLNVTDLLDKLEEPDD
jgi:hypothetical protein